MQNIATFGGEGKQGGAKKGWYGSVSFQSVSQVTVFML